MKRWRYMVWGGIGAGKTSLIRALQGGNTANKTQMIEYLGDAIDTPGEYAERKGYNRRLLVASADAQLFLVLQDATRDNTHFSPNYFCMYRQPVVGIVTKIDLPEADGDRAEALLRGIGVTGEILRVSVVTCEGLNDLRQILDERSKRWQITTEMGTARPSD